MRKTGCRCRVIDCRACGYPSQSEATAGQGAGQGSAGQGVASYRRQIVPDRDTIPRVAGHVVEHLPTADDSTFPFRHPLLTLTS